jgi:hypothetical protein
MIWFSCVLDEWNDIQSSNLLLFQLWTALFLATSLCALIYLTMFPNCVRYTHLNRRLFPNNTQGIVWKWSWSIVRHNRNTCLWRLRKNTRNLNQEIQPLRREYLQLGTSWKADCLSAGQQILHLLRKLIFNFRIYKGRLLVLISRVHFFLTRFREIHLILFFHPYVGLPVCPFPVCPPTKLLLYKLLISQCMQYAVPISYSLNRYHRNIRRTAQITCRQRSADYWLITFG